MAPTARQAQIFARMMREQGIEDLSEYLAHFSRIYIGRMVKRLADLSEKEAEEWIQKYKIEQFDSLHNIE